MVFAKEWQLFCVPPLRPGANDACYCTGHWDSGPGGQVAKWSQANRQGTIKE